MAGGFSGLLDLLGLGPGHTTVSVSAGSPPPPSSGGFRGILELIGIWPAAPVVEVTVTAAVSGGVPPVLGAPLLAMEHVAILVPSGFAILVPVSARHDPWQQVPTKGSPWDIVPIVAGGSGAPLLAMEHYAILTPDGAILIPTSEGWQQVATKGQQWTIKETR
jgi:hypothetical protein